MKIDNLAKQLARLSGLTPGKDIEIKFDPSKPEGDKDRTADSTKAREILGWDQKVSLDNGLEVLFRGEVVMSVVEVVLINSNIDRLVKDFGLVL